MHCVRLRDEEDETLRVQIETAQCHEGVEEDVLVRHQFAGNPVHRNCFLVVRVPKWTILKYLFGDGQHGHVLDVRVVFDSVADDVVSIVIRLPPAHGQPHESREDGPNLVVEVEVVDPEWPRSCPRPPAAAEESHERCPSS